MSDEFDPRRLAAEKRIFAHGLIPFAFSPRITTEFLEQFADELDAGDTSHRMVVSGLRSY